MQKMPAILIATDNAEDAKVVKQQLADEYENVFTSTNSDATVQDFKFHRPDYWCWYLIPCKRRSATISGYTASAAWYIHIEQSFLAYPVRCQRV
jgi:CheY-like chemotaxis protein